MFPRFNCLCVSTFQRIHHSLESLEIMPLSSSLYPFFPFLIHNGSSKTSSLPLYWICVDLAFFCLNQQKSHSLIGYVQVFLMQCKPSPDLGKRSGAPLSEFTCYEPQDVEDNLSFGDPAKEIDSGATHLISNGGDWRREEEENQQRSVFADFGWASKFYTYQVPPMDSCWNRHVSNTLHFYFLFFS